MPPGGYCFWEFAAAMYIVKIRRKEGGHGPLFQMHGSREGSPSTGPSLFCPPSSRPHSPHGTQYGVRSRLHIPVSPSSGNSSANGSPDDASKRNQSAILPSCLRSATASYFEPLCSWSARHLVAFGCLGPQRRKREDRDNAILFYFYCYFIVLCPVIASRLPGGLRHSCASKSKALFAGVRG